MVPFLDSQASHLAFPFRSRSPGLSAAVRREWWAFCDETHKNKNICFFSAYPCWRLQPLPVCKGRTDPAAPGPTASSSLSSHPLQSSQILPADRWEAVRSHNLLSSELCSVDPSMFSFRCVIQTFSFNSNTLSNAEFCSVWSSKQQVFYFYWASHKRSAAWMHPLLKCAY